MRDRFVSAFPFRLRVTDLEHSTSDESFLRVNPQRKLVLGLVTGCAAAWFIAAVHPVDRQAWMLENVLLIVFGAILSLTYRGLKFSSTSHVFIALFVLLHIVGAHYTYAQMPLGLWAKDYFGLSRNHYDRVAHGSFGLLLALPLRELLLRFGGIRGAWGYLFPPALILAVSGLFEILESIVAESVAPGKGVNWLGGQGDEWDAQNDMLAAFVGAVIMMSIVALTDRKKCRNEW
jgi:putative membrane protein